MPVTDIQSFKRDVTQTWKEAFENTEETSAAFHDLVTEFVDFVGDWKEFSDIRRLRMLEYIDGLDNVKDHWKEINDWISENSENLDGYVGSLSDIRNLFQGISAEVGGVRRRISDNVNIVRNLSRLANDNLAAIKQEGGLTESVVKSLEKKSGKLQEEYRARLLLLGVQEDFSNIQLIQKAEERELRDAKQELLELQRKKQLTYTERERLRILKNEVEFRASNLELLRQTTQTAVSGLHTLMVNQRTYFREQREGLAAAGKNALGANKITGTAKLLRRVGMNEEAGQLTRDYGEWVTRRVRASVTRDAALLALKAKQEELALETRDRDEREARAFRVTDNSNRVIRNLRTKKEQNRQEIDWIKPRWNRAAGRYYNRAEGGRFLDEESLNAAGQRVQELTKQQESLDKAIQNQVKIQKDFNRELESSRTRVRHLGEEVREAEIANQRAIRDYETTFDKPFNLSERLVENFKKGYLELGKWGGPLGAIVALGLAFFHELLKIDEEAVKTKRVIGQWADASALANFSFVTGREVLKTMRELGEQFHINPVQIFTPQELANVARAQKFTGMTAEAAGNLAVQSKIAGQNANTYRDAIAKGANAGNALNRSAINLSATQNDVLQTSRAIALSYGNNTAELAKAATTAATLGTNLQGVEEIAKSLMNFESSISAEMQAQLLTGRQLNLAKAREYALNNDLNGVAQEIKRQGMDAAAFSRMNYIQQEGMAKALGMSREQTAKMLIMQELNSGLTAKQVAAMTNMRKEDIEALSAQEKWQTMKQRFLESLVPLLEPVLQATSDILRFLTPIVGLISTAAGWVSRFGNLIKEDNVYLRALWTTALAIGTVITVNWIRGLRGAALLGTRLGGIFTGLAKNVSGIGRHFASWARPELDYAGRTARQRLRDVQRLERARRINPASARATSRATGSMGSTVSNLGKNMGGILKGAAAAAILAGAVWVLAKAAQEFEKVSWESIGKAVVGLVALTAVVAGLGAIMSSGIGTVMILAGAAAIAVIAGSVWILGNALKQVTAVPGSELQNEASGIRSIAGAIGELSAKLANLNVNKINALGKALKKLRNIGIQVATFEQPVERAQTVRREVETLREPQGIQQENLKAAAQEITIKQAQVQASAQQISVEQKTTDLSEVKSSLIRIEKALVQSRPDWNWLEFGTTMGQKLPWMFNKE